MKKRLFGSIVAMMVLFGLSGCAKQIWPQKIVFTPELNMAIDEQVKDAGLEDPIIIVFGKEGQKFVLSKEGKAFEPCRPPLPEDSQSAAQGKTDTQKQYTARLKAQTKTDQTVDVKDLPVCQGMTGIDRIFPIDEITILSVKKNPWCIVIPGPGGVYQEKCFPLPGE